MEIITKSRFEKDIKKLKKRGKDFSKLEIVLEKLVSGKSWIKNTKITPWLIIGAPAGSCI